MRFQLRGPLCDLNLNRLIRYIMETNPKLHCAIYQYINLWKCSSLDAIITFHTYIMDIIPISLRQRCDEPLLSIGQILSLEPVNLVLPSEEIVLHPGQSLIANTKFRSTPNRSLLTDDLLEFVFKYFKNEMKDLFNEKALLNIMYDFHTHFIFLSNYDGSKVHKYYTKSQDQCCDLLDILRLILNNPHCIVKRFTSCGKFMEETKLLSALSPGVTIYYS